MNGDKVQHPAPIYTYTDADGDRLEIWDTVEDHLTIVAIRYEDFACDDEACDGTERGAVYLPRDSFIGQAILQAVNDAPLAEWEEKLLASIARLDVRTEPEQFTEFGFEVEAKAPQPGPIDLDEAGRLFDLGVAYAMENGDRFPRNVGLALVLKRYGNGGEIR